MQKFLLCIFWFLTSQSVIEVVNKNLNNKKRTDLTIGFRTPHNKRNREQRIRISTYQKSCIVEYTISGRAPPYDHCCRILCAATFIAYETRNTVCQQIATRHSFFVLERVSLNRWSFMKLINDNAKETSYGTWWIFIRS